MQIHVVFQKGARNAFQYEVKSDPKCTLIPIFEKDTHI